MHFYRSIIIFDEPIYHPLNPFIYSIAAYLLLFSLNESAAQSFIPEKTVTEDSSLVAWLKARHEAELTSCKSAISEHWKYKTERYKERYEWVLEEIKNGSFLLNSGIESYTTQLLKGIKQSNPEIDKELKCLVMNSSVPNAFDMGNGIIVVFTGLIERLDNEAQLVFAICHEAAHYQLKHVDKMLQERAERFNEKKYNEAAKEALKQKYQVKKKFIELMKGDAFSYYSRSRDFELQADSLGLQYFMKTGYSLAEATSAIDLLEHIDDLKDTTLFDLKKIFSTGDYSFSDNWLYHEAASSLGGGFTNTVPDYLDSLKTHPDCKIRSATLHAMIDPAKASTGFVYKSSEAAFRELRKSCAGEIIYSELLKENLGRSVFLSLFYMKEYPSDEFPIQVIALSFAWLAKYKASLQCGSYVELPSSEFSDKYNRILEFLSEIKSKDAAVIGYWFLRRNSSGIPASELELAAHAYTSSARVSDTEAETYINQYIKMFPDGVFSKNLMDIKNKTEQK